MIRVISGTAGGRRLKTPEGMGTRPTTDQTREALFNILGYDVAGTTFLDLFAGSGAVGIEALSRGALTATFVEKDRRTAGILRENLETCGFQAKSNLRTGDVMSTLRDLDAQGQSFDYIFMDPPYAEANAKTINHEYSDVLQFLSDSCIAGNNCIIIVEHSYPIPQEVGSLRAYRSRRYGVSHLTFFSKEADI